MSNSNGDGQGIVSGVDERGIAKINRRVDVALQCSDRLGLCLQQEQGLASMIETTTRNGRIIDVDMHPRGLIGVGSRNKSHAILHAESENDVDEWRWFTK